MAAFTATIKSGSGYDAPWIIIKADTALELKDRINELHRQYVEQAVACVSKSFKAAVEHENKPNKWGD